MKLTDNLEMQKSLDVAEDARQTDWRHPSFAAELFQGRFRWGLLHPFPLQSLADRKEGDALLTRIQNVLERTLDPDKVDRTGEIPAAAIHGLAELGCFGIKIPKKYGGLGMSQVNYCRAISLIASHCASTAVWLSAHQSIGVPQPLLVFGTEAQRQKYLPRLAHGEVSAFALTEPWVGSDPAQMATTATPTADGKYYLLNGLKMWCSNGPIADILVVMAQTLPVVKDGKERKQITAFIVEKGTPGFSVEHMCSFMGLKGLKNGLLRFTDVKVPVENIIGAPGMGLKIALTTLNTGRLTLPAATCAVDKVCLRYSRLWAAARRQWGAPIGEHQAVSDMLGQMAADTFATEAVSQVASAMADSHRHDIRLEAAMAKYYSTEAGWRIVDDALQIRGGRGYETADSLRARGEDPVPIERLLRDSRINRIIEGTSEIMRLFISREALDVHFRHLMPLLNPRLSGGDKLRAGMKAASFYLRWYPAQWLPFGRRPHSQNLSRVNRRHLHALPSLSRRLARGLFHAMIWHRQKLEKEQLLLGCFVDIGTDLFTMSACLSYADAMPAGSERAHNAERLCDLFCTMARQRIADNFKAISSNDFGLRGNVGREILHGEGAWLEQGIMPLADTIHAPSPPDPITANRETAKR